MMNKLKDEITKLDLKISKIRNPMNGSYAILDGAVDLEKYLNSEYKIAWILKEVNSAEDEGGWDMRSAIQDLKTESGIKKGWEKTFAPICYATYGIFHDKQWEEIPNYWDKPEIVDILKNIVYLNIKKTTGVSVAIHNDLNNFYHENKEILLKQIEIYNPEIVICGNTFQFLQNDLDLKGFKLVKFTDSNLCAYISDKRIYLDGYHPSARIKKENYTNDIINAVKYWKVTKKQ